MVNKLFYRLELLLALQRLQDGVPLNCRSYPLVNHTGTVWCELATISGIAITMSIKMLHCFNCFIMLIFFMYSLLINRCHTNTKLSFLTEEGGCSLPLLVLDPYQ